MEAQIKINMDNDAFKTPFSTELANVLRELADRVELLSLNGVEFIKLGIQDENGNSVGELEIVE